MKAEDGAEGMDKTKMAQLLAAYDGFKAQEEQYLALLEKVMVSHGFYLRQSLLTINSGYLSHLSS